MAIARSSVDGSYVQRGHHLERVEKLCQAGERQERRRRHGKEGEELACEAYLKAGARLLARNYQVKCGELDLIVEEDSGTGLTLVFVEVRSRDPSSSWETPAESLTPVKLRRIRNAASEFLMRYEGGALQVRFDLASWNLTGLQIWKNFWWY